MKQIALEIVLFPIFVGLSFLSRFKDKKYDIGLGPEPMINNIYHKKALILFGYKVQTFVTDTYFITSDFDINLGENLKGRMKRLVWYYAYLHAIFNYKCLYIYFNGGPLFGTRLLKYVEPYLLKLARIKVVMLPYGGDVMDTHTNKNLLFNYGMITHYPDHCKRKDSVLKQVERWTNNAHYIFSGCDWVDYTYYWDKLMLAHFSIDTESWKPSEKYEQTSTFKILHAPNHRLIKGSEAIISSVNRLRNEGYDIELILLEKKPNSEVKRLVNQVDLIVDQLIIGWYAMFALEGMSSGKPVICFLREDLKQLYRYAGLLKSEIPLISANIDTIYDRLKELYHNRESLTEIGKKSRQYVIDHHSLNVIGSFFDEANKKLGINPRAS